MFGNKKKYHGVDCQLFVFQLSVKRMGYESAVYREFKFCCEKLACEGTLIFFVRKNLCRVFLRFTCASVLSSFCSSESLFWCFCLLNIIKLVCI